MRILKKSVRDSKKYLFEFSSGEKLHVVARINDSEQQKLLKYGFEQNGETKIPIPRGKATERNSNGKWLVRKDLPKEKRKIERDYHVYDWHGNEHSGTCTEYRMCYQKQFVKPNEISFTLENDLLISPLFANIEEDIDDITQAINVLLEMFGCCEIVTTELVPPLPPVKQKYVPWEILRSGADTHVELEKYLEKTTRHHKEITQNEIKKRHEYLLDVEPEFCVIGKENFWGYIIYAFPEENIFIFESSQPDNATYVFRGDWERASKLTKTEILSGHLQDERLFHTKNWEEKVNRVFNHQNEKEAV